MAMERMEAPAPPKCQKSHVQNPNVQKALVCWSGFRYLISRMALLARSPSHGFSAAVNRSALRFHSRRCPRSIDSSEGESPVRDLCYETPCPSQRRRTWPKLLHFPAISRFGNSGPPVNPVTPVLFVWQVHGDLIYIPLCLAPSQAKRHPHETKRTQSASKKIPDGSWPASP